MTAPGERMDVKKDDRSTSTPLGSGGGSNNLDESSNGGGSLGRSLNSSRQQLQRTAMLKEQRMFSQSPTGGVAHSDLSELQTSEGPGSRASRAEHEDLRKVVKKRRTDRRGGATVGGGGDSSSATGGHSKRDGVGNGVSSSSSRHVKPDGVSIGSRLARCQWVFVMWTPLVLLLLHRMDAIVEETHNAINTQVVLVTAVTLCLVAFVNELLDGVQWPYFIVSAASGVVFGATIKATEDLIAARMITVALFGVGSGLARYHWGLSVVAHENIAKFERRQARRRLGNTGTSAASGGEQWPSSLNNTTSGGGGTVTASDSDAQFQQREKKTSSSSSFPPSGGGNDGSSGSTMSKLVSSFSSSFSMSSSGSARRKSAGGGVFASLPRICAFLIAKIGLTVWFAGGELIGISVFVDEGITALILPSWSGYVLLILFPILTYKVSSWVSHALTMMFGSSRSVNNAGWMLAIYWVGTTVLSLGILFAVIFFAVWSWVPYVWGLQLVVAPYGIFPEYVANESRKVTKENPYREVVAAYKEHIDSTKQDRKKYHC